MKKTIIMLAAAVLAAACSTKPSDKTLVSGKLTGAAVPTEVHVVLKSAAIDTVIKVENSAFSIELPKDLANSATLEAGQSKLSIISDGTKIKVGLDSTGALTCLPGNSQVSVNARYRALVDNLSEKVSAFNKGRVALASDKTLSDDEKNEKMQALYNQIDSEYNALNEEALAKEKDNFIAVVALSNVYYNHSDEELDSIMVSLDTALLSNDFVKNLQTNLQAKRNTAEGKMFADFTAKLPDGKEAKLSDFVGKGKYMLVDFWASWCGPCKAEIPNLKEVYKNFKGRDFDMLSVAVWDRSAQASIDTAKVYGVKWNEMVDAHDVPTKIYGIQGVPHIILFGPDGTILKRDLRGEAIPAEVAKYVKK